MTPEAIQAKHLEGAEKQRKPIAPLPVAFNDNLANARYTIGSTLHVDLLSPYTSGPNDEWALPAQHIMIRGVTEAEKLRDFLTAAINHSHALKQ